MGWWKQFVMYMGLIIAIIIVVPIVIGFLSAGQSAESTGFRATNYLILILGFIAFYAGFREFSKKKTKK